MLRLGLRMVRANLGNYIKLLHFLPGFRLSYHRPWPAYRNYNQRCGKDPRRLIIQHHVVVYPVQPPTQNILLNKSTELNYYLAEIGRGFFSTLSIPCIRILMGIKTQAAPPKVGQGQHCSNNLNYYRKLPNLMLSWRRDEIRRDVGCKSYSNEIIQLKSHFTFQSSNFQLFQKIGKRMQHHS